jgi:diacylglycerol kinase family enzyme
MTVRFTFIINPASGSAKKALPEALRKRFPGSAIAFTERAGHAVLLARTAVAEGRIPVACGGDGTFRDVALGTGEKGPMGFIPLGTVNLLGLALGVPKDFQKAFEVLERGRTRPVYPGVFEADGEKGYFFIGISAGPDADAIHEVSLRLKKLIGRYAYALSLALRLARPIPPVIECETDGEKVTLGACIALRMPYYGGPFHMGKTTSLFEKDIEVVGVCCGRLTLLRLYASVLTGYLIPEPKIFRKMTHRAVIKSSTGRFQLDGDNLHAGEVTLSASPEPLEVIC